MYVMKAPMGTKLKYVDSDTYLQSRISIIMQTDLPRQRGEAHYLGPGLRCGMETCDSDAADDCTRYPQV